MARTHKGSLVVENNLTVDNELTLTLEATERALELDASGRIKSSSVTSTELGHLSGVTSAIQTQLNAKQNLSEKGVANGYASLDGNAKVPLSQLPNAIMEYKGVWNAATNTPTLADGAGNPDTAIGDVYRVGTAGTVDFGNGNITFEVGDYVILNDSKVWEKSDTTDAVATVFGRAGNVVAVAGDYDANQIDYDNTTSLLTATDVQAAIDELVVDISTKQDDVITTQGDLVIGDASGDAIRLPIGANGALLQSNGTTASWQVVNTADEQVKVTVNDTTEKYLDGALVVSDGVNTTNILEKSVLNPGANEQLQIQIDETKIDHDALLNFVSNEHIDHSAVEIATAADSGLTGGGDITATRNLSVDIDGTTAETSANNADTILIYDDSASALRKMTRENFLAGSTITSPGDLLETSFSGANDQTTPANVTGFAFANGVVRSFKAHGSIVVDATADLYEEFDIQGIQKGADWDITVETTGDNSLVNFTITTDGQIQYTSGNYAGFVSLTIKFRAITTSV